MFDEAFIENLPDDPALAGKKICDEFNKFIESLPQGQESDYYEEYLKALAMLLAYSEAHGVVLDFPPLDSNIETNINKITEFIFESRGAFYHKLTVGTLDQYRKTFERKFGKGFLYEFSDGDLKRIQLLINELKEMVSETKDLDDDHKLRLLKRLEKLQSELFKKVSDLDRFWGLLIDGTIVLKKVGENAKPIIDRIQEIAKIIWGAQIRAEELPSNIQLELPSVDKDD
jgi:hypothetical protein